MAAIVSASRPHSTVGWPWRAVSAASAVPHEPAPRTASRAAAGGEGITMASVAARRLPGRRRVALLALGALAQALGVQRVEVDRLQVERREAAGLDQVADELPRVG